MNLENFKFRNSCIFEKYEIFVCNIKYIIGFLKIYFNERDDRIFFISSNISWLSHIVWYTKLTHTNKQKRENYMKEENSVVAWFSSTQVLVRKKFTKIRKKDEKFTSLKIMKKINEETEKGGKTGKIKWNIN